MTELFFDTETSGLFPRNANPIDIDSFSKSRLVSIAWTLRDKKNIYSQHYYVVENEDKESEIGAEFIHGISRGMVQKFGKNIADVLDAFITDCNSADRLVAHNMEFDLKILSSELYRLGLSEEVLLLNKKNKICTMKTTTELCNIPGKWGKPKWPKLVELHKFLFDKEFENAHHAQCDVDATVNCFYRLMEMDEIIF